MEKAKAAVSEFLSKDGKHKTTVDQDVRGAVTEEHIKPHQHDEVTTAIDKSVHQDHHQTRIQPLQAKEVLPEKHSHNIMPVENKTIHHGNERDTRATLDREAAQFRDTSTTHSTSHSTSAAPVVSGERIHHHVHEHIQPVVNKETIQPQVVHTTVPVHETHHAAPVHHETTTLPTKTLEEFTGTGGTSALSGHGSQVLRDYEGCPKPYREGADAQRAIHGENVGTRSHEGHHGVGTAAGVGAVGVGAGAATSHHHKKERGLGRSNSNSSSSDEGGVRKTRSSKTAGLGGTTGMAGTGAGLTSAGSGVNTGVTGGHGHTGSSTGMSGTTGTHKPSLMDKLNPKKDADGDGKAGFLK